MSLALAVLSPFILAPLIPVLYRYAKSIHIGWFVLLIPITTFSYFLSRLPQIKAGEAVQAVYRWVPTLNINFTLHLDGLGLLFALIITGIGTLIIIYSIYYLSKEEALMNFYVYMLLFMGSMLGVVTSGNLILLYVFWELTSFTSFLLIGFWYHRDESRYGAQKAMLITVLGGLAMLAGFVLLYLITGTFEIREIFAQADLIKAHPLYLPTLILVLLGAFTKSAQVPFHIWLPNAMEAPTPVSAYLHSATMVKAGIFLIARLTPALAGTLEWFLIVSGVGTITMLIGGFLAIKQTDLKALLAFSTVSQLGLIIALLGFGTPGAVLGAMFHLVNHAAFKGSLFMVVGIVDHETGTRDIDKLSGLAKAMPITALIAGVGSLAMAGVPPFNGFLSKEMFFAASLETVATTFSYFHPLAALFPLIAFTGSIFTFIYSMMIFHGVFFGPLTKKTDKKPHEAPVGLLAPPLVLAALSILIGLYPGLLANTILGPVTQAILLEPMKIKISLWHGFNLPLAMSLGVILLGSLIYLQLPKFILLYQKLPSQPNMNTLYDGGLDKLLKSSTKLTNWQLTGYLRDYLVITLGFCLLVVAGTLWARGGLNIILTDLAPVELYEIILAIVIMLAALFVALAKTRLVAIIAAGTVGYCVALFFVLLRAPDLALTQLIVETVTLALFLLAFYHLPKGLLREKAKGKTINLAIAGLTGLLVTILALSAHNTRIFPSIAQYFIENSYRLAGGKNIVNVILVDFRGLDTLGEITVLAIAAFGVYAMIKLGKKWGKQT